METIAVLGAGYVGLTTAACFSKMGFNVIVSDVNVGRIEELNNGYCPIVEEGLPELIANGARPRWCSGHFLCGECFAPDSGTLKF